MSNEQKEKKDLPHPVMSTLAAEFTASAMQARQEPIPTGWPALDEKLGGLVPGLYVLGAVSSLGKSTFALQMAENIARRDQRPVLYFSLEMSSWAIAAKSVSRGVFTLSGGAQRGVQSRELLRRQDEARAKELEVLTAEARLGMSELSTLHIYTPGESGELLTARRIAETAGTFSKSPCPVVMVDYLQIIPAPPDDRDYRDSRIAIDRNIQILRELANSDPGMVVLVISSLNRDAYYEPIGMSAFKESGGIEYSADVLMGMEFTEIHTQRPLKKDGLQWLTQQKQQCPRLIDISILKQRYGESNVRVPFRYYPPWDTFQQTADHPYDTQAEEPVVEEASKKKKASGRVLKMNNCLLAKALRFYQTSPDRFWDKDIDGFSVRPFPESPARHEIVTTMKTTPTADCPGDMKEMTYWDMMVCDAIFTIYQENSLKEGRGKADFSFRTNDVLRLLSGDPLKPNKINLDGGKGIYSAIQATIKKLEGIHITINAKDEMRARRRQGPEPRLEFSGPFLKLWTEPPKKEGGPVPDVLYRFTSDRSSGRLHMPLYEYVMNTGQVIPVPIERLGTPQKKGHSAFSDSVRTMTIKHFAARGVAIAIGANSPGMRNLHLNTDEGLFQVLGISKDDGSRAALKRKNEAYGHVCKVLAMYQRELGLLTARQELPGKMAQLTEACGELEG